MSEWTGSVAFAGSILAVCGVFFYSQRQRLFLDSSSVTCGQFVSMTELCQFKGIFLDESRRQFVARHESILSELASGKLAGRNRFRELLLGVKSAGKTLLLELLKEFTERNYKNIVVVTATFDAEDSTPTSLVVNALLERKSNPLSNYELVGIKAEHSQARKLQLLESWLLRNNVQVLCLFDEFHFVYSKNGHTGKAIISETGLIAGSQKGVFHMVVTGSSTSLRLLAFCKMDRDIVKYPSYTGVDLNSTKLQPKWVHSITAAADFEKFYLLKELPQNEIVMRYILSGGRPGLILESCDPNDCRYSLSSKNFYSDNGREAKLLRCIYDCSTSYRRSSVDDEESIEGLQNLICPVPENVLIQAFNERCNSEDQGFSIDLVYNLADAGLILYNKCLHQSTISLSGIQIYLELASSSSHNTFTWQEICALKTPTGYFDELAENVAMRIFRSRSACLFQHNVYSSSTSYLNIPDGKNKPNQSNNVPMFTLDDSPSQVCNFLHKELYGFSRDALGSDAILLSNIDTKREKDVHLIRVQLKLGGGKYDVEEVVKIRNSMTTGGCVVKDALKKFGWNVLSTSNYLITTKYAPWDSMKDACTSSSKSDDNFFVIDSQELSKRNIWPEAVKSLGKPYGPNSNLNKPRGV